MDLAESRIRRVAIVGGGTAGWMAAAMLSKVMGPALEIRLVESDDIPTVGVGEATIPPIRSFNQSLGIKEDDFIRATRGTFKAAIQFEDWGQLGNTYMHAFGGIGQDLGSSFQHYWRRSIQSGGTSDFWDYSLNAQAAKQHRFSRAAARRSSTLTYAYHFDAGLYAQFLRTYSEANGVQRTEAKVVGAQLHPETGFIDSIRLASGESLHADLFIDCSGFRGLLIEQALRTGYEDWAHWLPCDRALAVPAEAPEALPPYTRSIAHRAGWQWFVPLQHRSGNGLVYSSQHLDEDAAIESLLAALDGTPLAEPRLIRFRTGRRKRAWNKNCVALGLAAGFIEPLESTSIHLIQTGVTRLVALFPGKAITEVEVDEYNRQSAIELERIRDFIILHYHVNQRTDSEFWRNCREMAVPDDLRRRIELFEAGGKVFREEDELFSKVAWLQVMMGQGLKPRDFHPVASLVSSQELEENLKRIRNSVSRAVAEMPTHEEVVREIIQ